MSKSSPAAGKKVLLFGVGLSTPPMIHYLTSFGIQVTACARNPSKIEKVLNEVKEKSLVTMEKFDISAPDYEKRLDEICPKCDIMVSMMPPPCHPKIAAAALKHGKHFFTSSYVSDDMAKLSPEFAKKGLLSINECGVDPGLDHMSAKKVIDEVHSKGGKILGFFSVCGGLPAPDCNNPFGGGYKISWTPYGVLSAGTNNALFKFQGQNVTKPGTEIYDPPEWKHVIDVEGKATTFEWYPNRDSTPYIEHYNMPECQSIIRGTYRNNGWCNTLRAIATLGLNDKTEYKVKWEDMTYLQAAVTIWNTRNADDQLDAKATPEDVKKAYAKALKSDTTNKAITDLEWVGMFSDDKVPAGCKAPIDVMCTLWTAKMQYGEDEKDMIVMQHIFEVEYKNGTREELTSTLINFGLGKYAHIPSKFTSMARTVSLPLACAIRMKLEDRIKTTGVIRPVTPDIYNAILDEVSKFPHPITFKEAALPTAIWLRHEVKPGEERTALTPETAKELIDAGFRVTVEKSTTRCIPIEEYEKVGCKIAETASWPSAPYPTIILGLKELPEDGTDLIHRHILFAHCYKGQAGWKELLARFKKGGGSLYDLEFLKLNGRRVAAFGRPAGMAGMALGLWQWAKQKLGQPAIKDLKSWKSKEAMCSEVKAALKEVEEKKGLKPSTLIIGALGRCGRGATWVAEQCGVESKSIVKWDMAETKGGGPFKALLDVDVLVNCIYLTTKIPAFLTRDMIEGDKKLGVFVDVSCDTSNPNNPFPFYNTGTTLDKPILPITGLKTPLDVVAIDHLPSLIPLESSINYSKDLTPYIKQLIKRDAIVTEPVWKDAKDLMVTKMKEAGL
uniref:Saccharopine dehydrogenase [NAD(+), L-lysine-forming] n=1 Tax=Lotharella globosa TaxID=91324 RepID=A0A7S3ZC48_9EUKA